MVRGVKVDLEKWHCYGSTVIFIIVNRQFDTTAIQPVRLGDMRPTLFKFSRYLEPGAPTGLTGLWTHNTPRSTLLYLYSGTLDKLRSLPETSLYRQSVEAVTTHRMRLVEQMVPPGHEEWAVKMRDMTSKKSSQFSLAGGHIESQTVKFGKRIFLVGSKHQGTDMRDEASYGEIDDDEPQGNVHDPAEMEKQVTSAQAPLIQAEQTPLKAEEKVEWEDEPQLTAKQVSELEKKIDAGLIEEVIRVAEGELRLIETMQEAKVWESLEQQPVEGQWKYFEREAM